LREGSPKLWFISTDPTSAIPDARALFHALGILAFSLFSHFIGNFEEAMKSGIPKLSARVGQALSQTIASIKVCFRILIFF
jgi:hypothetical protein